MSNQECQALTQYLDNHPRGVQALHFYPSTIRMLGEIMGDNSGTAFDGIENARFVFTWNHEEVDIAASFDGIVKAASDDGFEMLAQMDSQNSDVLVYMKDQSTPVFIILLQNSFGDFIIELSGKLSLQSISELGQMDFGSLAGTFGFSTVVESNQKNGLIDEPEQETE